MSNERVTVTFTGRFTIEGNPKQEHSYQLAPNQSKIIQMLVGMYEVRDICIAGTVYTIEELKLMELVEN